MKIKLFVYLLILTITNVNISVADDCNKFDKLSKEYAKCKAELIKENISPTDSFYSAAFPGITFNS